MYGSFKMHVQQNLSHDNKKIQTNYTCISFFIFIAIVLSEHILLECEDLPNFSPGFFSDIVFLIQSEFSINV